MAKAKPVLAADPPPEILETAEAPGEGREKTLAGVTHILGLLTLFLGPLVMYFVFKRKASPWLRAHLDEAVNYHILLTAAFVVLVVALAFLAQVDAVVLVVALVLLLLAAAHVVFGLVAIVKAFRGKAYHFPLDVRIVR
ncbi:MAG TPA: DUF4870 domain-containing protein [Candidatus Thermoplasmatota archaeon]|nr:DUF4870 domain-containing protein [Candidatus Thermoplasmatota archaeon]